MQLTAFLYYFVCKTPEEINGKNKEKDALIGRKPEGKAC